MVPYGMDAQKGIQEIEFLMATFRVLTAHGDEGEHSQTRHLTNHHSLKLFPYWPAKGGHEVAHSEATRKQIAEGKARANFINPQAGKLRFENLAIP